jgi:hypothetical protein
MLTIRFDRLGLRPGDMFLDAGAGFGRHAFEAARQGATVYALDYAADEVVGTRATFGGMIHANEIPPTTAAFYVVTPQSFRSQTTHLIALLPLKFSSIYKTTSPQSVNCIAFSNQVVHLVSPCLHGGQKRSTGCCQTNTTLQKASVDTYASIPQQN